MPSDAPTNRAALEALAERLESRSQRHEVISWTDHNPMTHVYTSGDLAEAAATLRALAAEREVSSSDPSGDAQSHGAQGVGGEFPAEPAADVAALVEEARIVRGQWHGWMGDQYPDGDRHVSLICRLAAALTAQAERAAAALARAEKAEALNKEAESVVEPFADFAEGRDPPVDGGAVVVMSPSGDTVTVGHFRAARALAAKLGEG